MEIGNADLTLKKRNSKFHCGFSTLFFPITSFSVPFAICCSAQREARDQPRDHIRN
jgi:hypothetical protein